MMLGICAFTAISLSAQKKKKEDFNDILYTKDIAKIERFLATAHPQDPRRTVLKPKLIDLKNKSWTKPGQAIPMPVYRVSANAENSVRTNPEAAEFQRLMSLSENEHKAKTTGLLNVLFNDDINSKETILLVKNNSDCDMIMRISGENRKFNLAVPAKGENTIVIGKGTYEMTSNVCNAKYTAVKDLRKSSMITLNSSAPRLLAAKAAPSLGKNTNAQK